MEKEVNPAFQEPMFNIYSINSSLKLFNLKAKYSLIPPVSHVIPVLNDDDIKHSLKS